MADATKKNEPLDYHAKNLADLEARQAEDLEAFKAQQERARALATVPQPVTDGNETAALQTITGQKPIRDESNAPPPNELGPHHSGEGTTESDKIDAEVKETPDAAKAKG